MKAPLQHKDYQEISKFGTVSIVFFSQKKFVKCVEALTGILNFTASWDYYGIITLTQKLNGELQNTIPFWRFGHKFEGKCRFSLGFEANQEYGDGFTSEVELTEPNNFYVTKTTWVDF